MEENTSKLTFPSLFNSTLNRHGNSPSYAFVGEEPITYRTAAQRISSVTAFLNSGYTSR